MLKYSSIIILVFLISGCATLSKDECLQANWHSIGYKDGAKGSVASRFQDHQKACAKYGIKANYEIYRSGHQQGLTEVYCKPGSAYQIGLRGETYKNVCPAEMEKDFLPAYNYGRDIYRLSAQYQSLSAKSNTLKMRISGLDQQISDLRQDITRIKMGRGKQTNNQIQIHIHPNRQKINAMQSYVHKRRLFAVHNRHEQALHQSLVQNYQRKLQFGQTRNRGNHQSRHSQPDNLNRFVALHTLRGELNSQIVWERLKPSFANKQSRNLPVLKNKLDQVKTQLRGYNSHPLPLSKKQLLARLAFQQGVLSHHVRLNSQINNPLALNTLIRLHFDRETNRVQLRRQLNGQKQSHGSRREQIRQLHREMRTLRREKQDALHHLDQLAEKTERLQHDINDLKSRSPY